MISKVEKCTMKRFYLLYKLFVHIDLYVDMDINVNLFKCFLNVLSPNLLIKKKYFGIKVFLFLIVK